MHAGPPAGVPSERLFRMLADRHPSMVVDVPTQAQLTDLRVLPLPALREAAILDRIELLPKEIHRSRMTMELISACLSSAGALVFPSGDDVAALYEDEIDQLGEAVLGALNQICPSYTRSDWPAWKIVLEAGARHPSNKHLAIVMSQCADRLPMSDSVTPRPDRFWGVPFAEMLDGWWMVYRAARAAYG